MASAALSISTIASLRELIARKAGVAKAPSGSLTTGLEGIDALLPQGCLAQAAVHEVLTQRQHAGGGFFAALLAKAAVEKSAGKVLVWSDPQRTLYPQSLASVGIPLERLVLLRPANVRDELWALSECLRCKAVSAAVASVSKLSQIEARRIQLAAEQGGGIGILLRRFDPAKPHVPYSASTRWLVEPARGTAHRQRWTIQLIHGHGGRTNHPVLLEIDRETRECKTHLLRPTEELADQSGQKKVARAIA